MKFNSFDRAMLIIGINLFGLVSCGGSADGEPEGFAPAAPLALRALPEIPVDNARTYFGAAVLKTQSGEVVRRLNLDVADPAPATAGPDGEFFTGDDKVASYEENRRDPTSNLVMRGRFSGPGADGVWFSADDEFAPGTYYGERKNAQGELEEECSFQISDDNSAGATGPDGERFTFDDVPFQCSWYVSPLRYVTFPSSGPDGNWRTSDDVPNFYLRLERDQQDRVVSQAGYYAGDDGKLDTGDDYAEGPSTRFFFEANGERIVDFLGPTPETGFRQNSVLRGLQVVVGNRQRTRFDASDYPLSDIRFSSAGADGVWGTEDDVMKESTQWQYVSNIGTYTGLRSPAGSALAKQFIGTHEIAQAGDAAPVERILYFTPDAPFSSGAFAQDALTHYDQFYYPDQSTIERVSYALGQDGVAFTDDDVITDLAVAREGVVAPGDFAIVSYSGPGADGLWRTEDDVIEGYALWRTTTLAGGVAGSELYTVSGAGLDQLWFTQDDVGTRGIWLEKVVAN